ncbi:primase C-terminal domain-containing protein [Candidatus Enterococcus ikei]|uniref:Primase C-terminal domain-containing protein n=1 Tax=Candidatus Enterococcus ikei TaxID=2815326 RepID=A0ABS3H2Y1_9ENTE|nr:primase C-terminal domain-containing protein [Enterococcus sp. DIV0869a]MBO0441518.1 primase C-terminal domain-containing protein [Enterococcus sp. DIV0869a]
MQVSEIVSLVLKNGIRKYKFKNSKVRPFNQQPEGNKGAVFGFRSKENMITSRGVVLTSEEALAENEDCFTHWTPNVYSYGTYADPNKTIVKGHAEENLKQINAFVIDFDRSPGETLDAQMIQNAGLDLDLIPTLILKTPGGYQAYFILENAWYISSKNNYQSVEVAKRVSENLRKAFAEEIPGVDHGCNHFGIARIPRNDNVSSFYPALTYDMQQLITWSMKYQPAAKKPFLQLVPPAGDMQQIKEKWVDILIKNPEIIGKKGQLGRNNAFFTLALACYSSGKEQSECYDFLDELNEKLNRSMKDMEVKRIVKSAYSGRYKGANKDYVLNLLANWTSESLSEAQLFTQKRTTWYKFKKDRTERKKSHVREWKADILKYLETQCYRYRPEIEMTKGELQAAVKYQDKSIPKRSLDKAINELKAEGKIYVRVRAGRGGGLVVATRKALIRTVIVVKQEVKSAYKSAIRTFFHEAAMLTKLYETATTKGQIGLFGEQTNLWDTG